MKVVRKLAVFILAFCLLFQTAAVFAASEDWTYENSVLVSLDEEKAEAGKTYTPADFLEVEASKVMVYRKVDNKAIQLIIVLKTSNEQDLAAAMKALAKNELVSNVSQNNKVPFESYASLNKSSAALRVGETVALKCESTDISGVPGFSAKNIVVQLEKVEEGKTYTPADFPEYPLSEVKEASEPGYSLLFTLQEEDYFTLCKTIDAMSKDARFKSVSDYVLPTGARIVHNWSIKDTSIAQFESDVETDAILYGTEGVVIKALKPGKTTVTLEVGYPDESGPMAYVTCEITVPEEDETVPSTSDPVTTTQADDPHNPDTGSESNTMLIALAATSLMAVCLFGGYRAMGKRKHEGK